MKSKNRSAGMPGRPPRRRREFGRVLCPMEQRTRHQRNRRQRFLVTCCRTRSGGLPKLPSGRARSANPTARARKRENAPASPIGGLSLFAVTENYCSLTNGGKKPLTLIRRSGVEPSPDRRKNRRMNQPLRGWTNPHASRSSHQHRRGCGG